MEIWKDIGEYAGLYQVSSIGRVKALAREITNKNGELQRYPEKILKPDVNSRGITPYYRVTLCKNHQTKKYSVHRLVAEAFIDNPENKPFINHIDNNGINNVVCNLEWCTHSENMIHAQNQGRLFSSQSLGGKNGSRAAVSRAIKDSEDMVGKVFNGWKVLYPLGKQGSGKGKYYLQCMCLSCLREFRIEAGRLRRNEATTCRTCSRRR